MLTGSLDLKSIAVIILLYVIRVLIRLFITLIVNSPSHTAKPVGARDELIGLVPHNFLEEHLINV